MAERVVRAQEPRTIPAVRKHRLLHGCLAGSDGVGLLLPAIQAAQRLVIRTDAHKHARDEQRFRHAGLEVGRGLEALARGLGEAVEVQAVVPVGAADQRQAVRPQVLQRVVEAAPQMLHQRLGQRFVVVKGHHLGEDGHIARLLDVGRGAEDQPQRVVVEAGADVEVAALGQRLILVVCTAVRELRRRDVQQAFACARGNQMHKAQQILRGIAEAHAAADAGLVVARRARHVEGDHALILVPDVDHAVKARLAALHLAGGQQRVPVFAQLRQRAVELRLAGKLIKQRVGGSLVNHAGRDELLVLGIFAVAQHEDKAHAFARRERAAQVMAADGRPAAGDRVAAAPLKHSSRVVKAVVRAQEAVAVGVKAVDRCVHGVDGVVIAALTVLGLVVDRAALDLHLAGGEVALEIGRVILRVPQAELHKAEQGNLFGRVRPVGELHARHQGVHAARHHRGLAHAQAVLFAGDHRVAQAVAALVGVQRGLDRHPARGEDRVAVLDVEVLPAGVGGHVVVAVAGDAQHARILIEAVAAARIGHQRKERLAAQVVDPGRGRVRPGDHVLPGLVVKMAILHGAFASLFQAKFQVSSRICANCDENDLDCIRAAVRFSNNIPHFFCGRKGFSEIRRFERKRIRFH